jgi:capsular exopolysaccharide synthesis family protein
VSIANSGKQVLLVDADFRRPRIHKLFGLENKTGLACTIAKGDDVDPLEAIQPTDTPNLFCLTSGKQPDNPGELLTSSAFDRFLDVVRAKYDYVIIDTPPMLVVTDPSTVAARADGVILIIRLSKHSRATASQAAAMLSAVGAKVIGVVVNGFGQSSYGRQMGYAAGYRADQYGYGYDYAAKEAAAYYANGSQEHPDAANSPIVAKDANQA